MAKEKRKQSASQGEMWTSTGLFQRIRSQETTHRLGETRSGEMVAQDESRFQANLATVPVQAAQFIENRTGLPDQLRAGLEQLSGLDLSAVRVHRNSTKPAQLNALAYAQGQDIHLSPGQERHLPHEGWHVVQQMQRRVKPTMHGEGVAINNDYALEREADQMGAKAAGSSSFTWRQKVSQLQAGKENNVIKQKKSTMHDRGCGCSTCSSQLIQKKNLNMIKLSSEPIQLCVDCGDNRCIKGERCGYDRTHGGLFRSDAANAPAVLPYNSSNAKRQSGKAVGRELEHPIAGAALRLRGEGAGYRREYTIPIDKSVHRGATSGAGGGISSTGSSSTAKGWAQYMAGQSSYDMVRLAAIEQYNAHFVNGKLDQGVAIRIADWLRSQVQNGRITEDQFAQLLNALIDRFHRDFKGSGFGGGSSGGGHGSGGGGMGGAAAMVST